jgi:hypothetical protein
MKEKLLKRMNRQAMNVGRQWERIIDLLREADSAEDERNDLMMRLSDLSADLQMMMDRLADDLRENPCV